jgi:hypothetical protein
MRMTASWSGSNDRHRQTLKLCKKPLSQVIIAPRAQASKPAPAKAGGAAKLKRREAASRQAVLPFRSLDPLTPAASQRRTPKWAEPAALRCQAPVLGGGTVEVARCVAHEQLRIFRPAIRRSLVGQRRLPSRIGKPEKNMLNRYPVTLGYGKSVPAGSSSLRG